jgi:hypothetical protein
MIRIALSLATLLLLAGCEEPFIVFAGGELTGEVVPAPEDWSSIEQIDTVQLETQPDDPYSVNIWVAAVGADLYVATGADGTSWSEHIAEGNAVRVRAETEIFELEAYQVFDASERARVAKAYVDKYDLDETDNWVMKGMIFRLDRR